MLGVPSYRKSLLISNIQLYTIGTNDNSEELI